MKENKEKIKIHNCEIFNHIYLNMQTFTLRELDELFELPNGSMQKATKGLRGLTRAEMLVLEDQYDIPSEVFNNLNITPDDAIKKINEYKDKKITIINDSPLSLQEFKRYKFFYVFDKQRENVLERQIEIDNSKLKIFRTKRQEKVLNFEGYVFSNSSSVLGITKNPITGNNVLFKVQRSSIVGPALPITYLGHRTLNNDEVADIGICSKRQIPNEALKILDTKEEDFTKRKNIIIDRLREYEREFSNNYYKEKEESGK